MAPSAAGSSDTADVAAAAAAEPSTAAAPATAVPVTAAPATTAAPTTTARVATSAVAPAPAAREVADLSLPTPPFASVEGVTLLHPSTRVERVGFHQSNHEGARQLATEPTAVAPLTLDARERLTGGQSAADVVIDPAVEVRSPVTGTVKRGGGYTLYCKYRDDFVVIAPDARPQWEVKILHIDGLRVRAGERVVAGETVLAPRATQLPFASQIDDVTADPAWPHVHIEVVDPSIRNIPSPGGGC